MRLYIGTLIELIQAVGIKNFLFKNIIFTDEDIVVV